jgi:hypothetical protein
MKPRLWSLSFSGVKGNDNRTQSCFGFGLYRSMVVRVSRRWSRCELGKAPVRETLRLLSRPGGNRPGRAVGTWTTGACALCERQIHDLIQAKIQRYAGVTLPRTSEALARGFDLYLLAYDLKPPGRWTPEAILFAGPCSVVSYGERARWGKRTGPLRHIARG